MSDHPAAKGTNVIVRTRKVGLLLIVGAALELPLETAGRDHPARVGDAQASLFEYLPDGGFRRALSGF